MPPSNTSASNPRPSAVDPQQIASSNATASAFLGGRQPSWMTGRASTVPTLRPVVNRQNSQAAQKQPAPAILPSPAPSDAPSPALSNALDSPNTNPASLPDAQNMAPAISASAALPVTEARFVVDPVIAGPTYSQEVPRLGNTGPSPVADNRPFQSQGGGPTALERDCRSSGQNGVPSPSLALGSLPPPKRRRIEQPPLSPQAAPLSGPYLLASIDQLVRSCGGEQSFEPSIEKPRLMILREACKNNDMFFLALHQLFCIWSQQPRDAHLVIPQKVTTINSAFSILQMILKKNDSISPVLQNWFVQFPVSMSTDLEMWKVGPGAKVEQIAVFLHRLAHNYDRLSNETVHRGYPFVVDELLAYLYCYSPVLQKIIFTACRRRLGVPDGDLGTRIEQAFQQDQNRHCMQPGGPQILGNFPHHPGEVEMRNRELIDLYRQIVSEAAGPQGLTQPGPQPSPGQQSGLINPSPGPQPSPGQQPGFINTSFGAQGSSSQQRPMLPSYSIPGPFPQAQPGPSGVAHWPGSMQGHPYTSLSNSTQPAGMQTGMPNHHQALLQSQAADASSNRPAHPMLPQHQQPLLGLQGQHLNQQQYLQNWQASGNFPIHPAYPVPSQARQGTAQQSMGQHAQQIQQIRQVQQQQPQQIQQIRQMQQQQQQPQQTQQIQPIQQLQQMQQMHQMQQQQQMRRIQDSQQVSPAANRPSVPYPPQAVASRPSQSLDLATAQQAQRGILPGHTAIQVNDLLLPPLERTITRPEWPYDPSDKKSILMSLHQAEVRSPKRVMRDGARGRFYQAVKSLAVKPTPITPRNAIYEFSFEVTEEQFALLATRSKQPGILLPVVEHFNGALRWRVRCCMIPSLSSPLTEQQWVTRDVKWPPNIFVTFNQNALEIRRDTHNGKDLPAEITNFIVRGTNTLKVVLPELQPGGALDRYIAVEMIETLSHLNIINTVRSFGMIPEEETLGIIKKRLSSSPDDDVTIEAHDLPIDLADPFSSTIFKTPARGVDCTHLECFDLEIWLNTRPSKPPIKCSHGQVDCGCKTVEPSNPDKWRCPICSKDARPYSLRIDSFLSKVREQLEREGKLRAKCIRVKADGSWSAVVEDDDDGVSDGEDGLPSTRNKGKGKAQALASFAGTATSSASAANARRQEVEIIEID